MQDNGTTVHKQGTSKQLHTDLGAGGGGSGDVATNLFLSEGLSATFLFSAKFLPWFKLTTRLATGITGCWGKAGVESDWQNLEWEPPSETVCRSGGGLWCGGGWGWVLCVTVFKTFSCSTLLLLDLVSKLWILKMNKSEINKLTVKPSKIVCTCAIQCPLGTKRGSLKLRAQLQKAS